MDQGFSIVANVAVIIAVVPMANGSWGTSATSFSPRFRRQAEGAKTGAGVFCHSGRGTTYLPQRLGGRWLPVAPSF
jgi:hypothetical protein